MGIFDQRTTFKPFEYPDIIPYKDAINHSYWLVSEWNFIGDVQDFNVKLSDAEKNAIKNTLLAISQVEVSVKRFWTRLGDTFPKPEFEQVGVTFGESEIRHADAYSHLLQVLGLNDDFSQILSIPAIQGRVSYLKKYMNTREVKPSKKYIITLSLFSLFVENVSLFSQFVVIKSFNKYKNVLKDTDNVIQATQKEELLHALFGFHLISLIKKEYPEWFDDEFYQHLEKAVRKAYDAECGIIDWIFEAGELSFLSKDSVKEFIKNRFNESVQMIGGNTVFTDVNQTVLKELSWFNDEIYAEVNTDFFHKRPVTYSKKVQSVNSEDLF